MVPAVIRELVPAVPDAPVVCIADVLLIGVLIVTAGGRRRRPVKGLRGLLLHHLRQNILVELYVIIKLFVRSLVHRSYSLRSGKDSIECPLPVILQHLGLHFIVAAPQPHRRMMAESADHFHKFLPQVFLEFIAEFIAGTCEHKILPHKQTVLIAQIVEEIIQIVAAAPDADGIVVCLRRILQQNLGSLPVDTLKNIIFRNIISAHCKDRESIYNKVEMPPLLPVLPHLRSDVRILFFVRNR